MTSQLDIFTVHQSENNPESQRHLDKNRPKFNRQCQQVFDMLMKRTVLSTYTALVNHKIGHLPRRIKDLRESGVMISDCWDGGSKHWYMTPEDKSHNKKLLEDGTNRK